MNTQTMKGGPNASVQALVLDLDGTLLDSCKEVSERNLQALMSAYRQGWKIIIATARPPRSVKELLPEDLLQAASFVYYNGAYVHCPHTGLTEHYAIPPEISLKVLEFWEQNGLDGTLCLEDRDAWYSLSAESDPAFYHSHFVPLVVSMDELKKLSATKLLLTNSRRTDLLEEAFREQLSLVVTDRASWSS
ncbi:HAD hydrolase family protein [Paenibacillus aurantius]|uniref:HAD hydrolase family protein n=1 Tax=Paenibacillus aurantius TaxID=2918900 RepID=A0AA96LBI4_9BACL|nr:HAD hydrolase family protein [Paenibacillus aurantius]WNQ10641.1 HAD hydrolase family protein [Paenibacillus aurantius]